MPVIVKSDRIPANTGSHIDRVRGLLLRCGTGGVDEDILGAGGFAAPRSGVKVNMARSYVARVKTMLVRVRKLLAF